MDKSTNNHYAKFIGQTPMDERHRFIRFLNQSGFTVPEIRAVYPTMSVKRIKRVLKNENMYA